MHQQFCQCCWQLFYFLFVYKFVDRFVPKSLNIIFTGFLSMAISAPIMLCLIAPVGNYCGTFLAQFLETFFTTSGPVAGWFLLIFIILCYDWTH